MRSGKKGAVRGYACQKSGPDTWFIGQTGDPQQVAAVTVSYPIFMLLGGLGNLFGIGGESLISRLLGRREPENAGKIGTFVIWASGMAALFYSLLICCFGTQVLSVLGTGWETLVFAEQYLFWTVVAGGMPMVINQVLANIVRAQGRARTASIGMPVGGILNVALDPLFIFGLHMNGSGFLMWRRCSRLGLLRHYRLFWRQFLTV